MTTIIQMNAAEMDDRFVEAIKSLFRDSAITISIENTPDLTELLNNDLPTRQQLTKAVNESRSGHVIKVEIDDLFKKIEEGVSFDDFVAAQQ